MAIFREGVVVVAALLVVAGVYLWRSITPEIAYHVVSANAKKIDARYEPVQFGEDVPAATITAYLTLGRLFPTRYDLKVDDCLLDLQVNGQVVAVPEPRCRYPHSFELDFEKQLRSGRNVVKATVINHGGHGGLVLSASRSDRSVRLLAGFLVMALGIFVFIVLWRTDAFFGDIFLWALCSWGIVLRTAYYLLTPYWARGYDFIGHLQYIDYLRANWSLPPMQDGWMFYQPPVYYTLLAALSDVVDLLAPGKFTTAQVAQLFGFLCSVVFVLLLTKCMSALFFSALHRRVSLAVGLSWPGLVLFSSRINNDVLLAPMLLLVLVLFLAWWRKESARTLLLTALVLSLCALIKTNALVLCVPLVLFIIWSKRPSSMKKALSVALVVALIGGAYHLYRFSRDGALMMGGNTAKLDEGLRVETSVGRLLALSPRALLEQPYTDSRALDMRRDLFPEYWFRSSLFAEFQYGDSSLFAARGVMVAAMLVFGLALLGVALSRRKRDQDDTLLLGILLVAVVTHLLYRLMVPYSCAQDFRYTWFALIPVWYFFARSVEHEYRGVKGSTSVVAVVFLLFASLFVFDTLSAPLPMWR